MMSLCIYNNKSNSNYKGMLMKKTIFLLLPLFSAVVCYGQEDDRVAPHGEVLVQQCFAMDEYEMVYKPEDEEIQLAMQEENALQEYEQYICDTAIVKPPKPYSISALFTSFGCTLLIQYISLTEKTKVCLANLKNVITKWVRAHS